MPATARYIGLDVHKASISVSVAEEGRDGEVRFIGAIASTSLDVAKLARRLAKEGSPAGVLLRGRSLRLRSLSPAHRARSLLHGRRAVADPDPAG